MTRRTKINTPVDTFIDTKIQIDVIIEYIAALSAGHFSCDPELITWEDAAKMALISQILTEAANKIANMKFTAAAAA